MGADEIVRKLVDVGELYTGAGYPTANDDTEDFLQTVRERIPELANLEDWELEETVTEALEQFIRDRCSQIREYVENTEENEAYEKTTLYTCSLDEPGDTFIVVYKFKETGGIWQKGYMITRSEEKAWRYFNELVETLIDTRVE